MASERLMDAMDAIDYRMVREVWANAYQQTLTLLLGNLLAEGQSLTAEQTDAARAAASRTAEVALADYKNRVDTRM